jgi:tRNA-2-methylthio-N6-dimethylallyladenosine synthase
MNVHDSEQMAVLLKSSGYEVVDDIRKADLVIVNTCSVREKAEQKAHSLLGRLRTLKQASSRLIVGVGGCLAQQMGEEFFKRFPCIDLVFGTHNIHRLPDMVKEIEERRSKVFATEFHKSVRSLGIFVPPKNTSVSAYVTVMQGCNNFCSYCIVPYLRGREESREGSDIVDEIRFLAEHGIKEVVLLGQNVNSYGKTLADSCDFSALLRMVDEVDGIERIRFTTSHPKDLSENLVRCFSEIGKLCEHIHLPVQSGSDSVLKRMKRGYTASYYIENVDKLRESCPHISITSDIIVGFPGETDGDFQKTIDLMEKVRFDNTFSFKYSDRPGIASEKYEDKVDENIKAERLSFLQSLQESHTFDKNKELRGKTEYVLVEKFSRNGNSDVMGRTRTNRIVNFEGCSGMIGQTKAVLITKAYMHSLRGDLLSEKEN